MRLFALVGALMLAGCIDPGGKGDTGYSCGSLPSNARLRAVDANTAVALPFSVSLDGEQTFASMGATDLDFALLGPHTVVVSSDGHAAATLHLDGGRVGAQCPAPLYTFDLWVPLTPL
jgi:hypothetical protein